MLYNNPALHGLSLFSRITIQISNSPLTEGSTLDDVSASTHQTSLVGVEEDNASVEIVPGHTRTILFSTPEVGSDCQ